MVSTHEVPKADWVGGGEPGVPNSTGLIAGVSKTPQWRRRKAVDGGVLGEKRSILDREENASSATDRVQKP